MWVAIIEMAFYLLCISECSGVGPYSVIRMELHKEFTQHIIIEICYQ
jgi:hypothetical protein